MKISILSDLHLDFYFHGSKRVKDVNIKRVFDSYLSYDEEFEVLVIAGDISHYVSQVVILERIAKLYNYKRIFCVLGNHDLYLISSSARYKYENNSRNRMAEWFTKSSECVRFLDGTIEEYKGVTFGGAMGWYDGTYNAPTSYNYADPVSLWEYYMNDSKYIKGFKDFYDLLAMEKPKVKNILSADVVITHVCPISHRMAFQDDYQEQTSSMFYAFDGEDLVAESKAQCWVFGHSHGFHEFMAYDTHLIMNAKGYPNEASIQHEYIEVLNAS